jgi:CHAT domain-containing protein
MPLQLDRAELAFLSACETARPGAQLSDEAIHLTTACQLAGFRDVIGTLWTIADHAAVEFADAFYDTLLGTPGDVAAALHAATRRTRDAWLRRPSLWAAHIHVGP